MNIFRRHPLLLSCGIGFAVFSGALAAQGFDQLKDITGSGLGGAASSLGLSSMTSGSTGNAAGIIEYCMKNNYLSGDNASSVRDQLMGKITGGGDQSAQNNPDYINGAQGILSGSAGQNVDLSMAGMKASAVKKVCETILEQGKSML
jgi:hypothetical protein